MAPSTRTATATTNTKTTSKTKAATTTTTKTTRTTRTRRRTGQPRRTAQSKKQEVPTVLPSCCSSISSSKEGDMDMNSCEVIDVPNTACCSTPKGQKFQIPEISTCPPAPKKPRVLSNCSLRRTPLSFFAPPDLELFFFTLSRDVSV